MAGRVTALRGALSAGDRTAARKAWAQVYERYLLIGAAYGALGTSTRRSPTTGCSSNAGSGGRVAGASCARPPREPRGRRAAAAADRPEDRDHRRWTTRSARTRSSRTPSATCSAASPRPAAAPACGATAASVEATYAVVGDAAAPACQARGAIAPSRPGLLGLRRELDAIRRAHGGEWPPLDALSAERAPAAQRPPRRRPGDPGASAARARDPVPARVPELRP